MCHCLWGNAGGGRLVYPLSAHSFHDQYFMCRMRCQKNCSGTMLCCFINFYQNDLWYPEMKAVSQLSYCFLMEWVVVVFVILIPSTTKPCEMLFSIEISERHFIHHLSV